MNPVQKKIQKYYFVKKLKQYIPIIAHHKSKKTPFKYDTFQYLIPR